MPLALTADQIALAQSVSRFAERHCARESTRKDGDKLKVGERPELWLPLLGLGLHAVHLPENVGGQGGSVEDAGVVIAEAGRCLIPGPLLPTVIASTVSAAARRDDVTRGALQRFAQGATGAVILPSQGVAFVDEGGDCRLSGSTDLVLGAASADLLIIGATQDGGAEDDARWFVLDAATAGIEVNARAGVDLGRDVGVVHFRNVSAGESNRLTDLDTSRAVAIVAALMAAEASGVITWLSETATEFVKGRTQFGRPIGAFQAVQHRAAQLLITSELATASAWDAVRSLREGPSQRTRAVAAAAIMALGRGVHAAVECVGLHGAIGFTWDHDLHLYWRRAIALAGLGGPLESWELQLGEAALAGSRDFSLTLPETDPSFREWVSGILDQAAELSNPHPSAMGPQDAVASGPRRTLLADSGLVAPPWPAPFGVDAGPLRQLIIREEFDRRGLAQPAMGIGQWVLSVVVTHGTAEQIDLVAASTLRGEAIWCQLFSEPGAGSDVASLSLRGTKVDGGWTLTGQKVWTTHAHLADWGLCLARTDTESGRHGGLSMFIIDMHSPALDVRPIKQANGQADFNEVFFNDTFVPDSMLIGEPGQGWDLTIATLAQERSFIGTFGETVHEQRIRQLVAAGGYAGSRPNAVRTLGSISARGAAVAAMNLRETLRRLDGHGVGPETSIAKAAGSMLHIDAAAAALNLAGPAAALNETACEPVFQELDLPTWVIGGGTLEIQLNTIATFVMGLPRK